MNLYTAMAQIAQQDMPKIHAELAEQKTRLAGIERMLASLVNGQMQPTVTLALAPAAHPKPKRPDPSPGR